MTLDLDALEALEKKATQGPWSHETGPAYHGQYHTVEAAETMVAEAYMVLEMHDGTSQGNDTQHDNDAEFVAAARNALPELIRLARIGQRVEREVVQLGLCEIRNLTLKADTLYRFKKMHQCVSCQNYEDGK